MRPKVMARFADCEFSGTSVDYSCERVLLLNIKKKFKKYKDSICKNKNRGYFKSLRLKYGVDNNVKSVFV